MSMSDNRPRISIVVPVYNSEDSLPILFEQISKALDGLYDYEIIAVNDCSSDKSLDVLLELCGGNSMLHVVELSRNSGQENAILAGFSRIQYEYVVCLDDDLQHDPADIPKMIEVLIQDKLDLVFARFVETGSGSLRRFGTWMNDVMMNLSIKKPRGLALSSFLVMRRFVADKAAEFTGPHPYLAGQYLCLTDRVGNVDLIQHKRQFKESNYSLSKLVGVWLSGLVNFSLVPLRFLFWLGLILFVIAGIFVSILVVNRLVYGELVPMGWTSLMIVVLLMASIQMLALGLLGEYLGRALLAATNFPRYSIRAVHNSETERHTSR